MIISDKCLFKQTKVFLCERIRYVTLVFYFFFFKIHSWVPHHREENDNQKNPAFRRRLKRVMMVN